MLRGSSLAFLLLLLFLSADAASAMDQSATEETNCLMACDANEEHCASTSHVTTPRNYSRNYSVAAHPPAFKSRALASSLPPVEAR